jgi:hypothetical protein
LTFPSSAQDAFVTIIDFVGDCSDLAYLVATPIDSPPVKAVAQRWLGSLCGSEALSCIENLGLIVGSQGKEEQ